MTPKQKKVFDFITTYRDHHGYAPSQQEIASGCGFQSLGTVQHYLKLLERDGFLSRRWNGRRSVELNSPLETVAAGIELPFLESWLPVGQLNRSRCRRRSRCHQAWPVPATSCTRCAAIDGRPGVMDGDYVTVHTQPVAENGQTVIAELNGSVTIKRFVRKGDRIELHPANPSMSPIIVEENDEFRIRGILVGSMRLYKRWKGKYSTS